MKFPKLKNARISRIATYLAVLIPTFVLIAAVCCLNFISEVVKGIIVILILVGLIVFLLKKFVILMTMDAYLGTLHCKLTARKQFDLPGNFSESSLVNKIEKFGQKCEPKLNQPQPISLRYKFSSSQTIYASGIEKVIATYSTDNLDKDTYRNIMGSALSNSLSLKGKTKPRFIDSEQKKAPLNRVTVVFILAREVEENFKKDLFKTVCQKEGDGFDVSVLPCIINLKDKTCVFNSERIAYIGFQYSVKNRGIRIIRKLVFGGKLPLTNEHMLELDSDTDLEQTVWEFWRKIENSEITERKKEKSRFKQMTHREIIYEDELLYIKLNDKGVCLIAGLDEQGRQYEVFGYDLWEYPKTSKISKADKKEIKSLITTYFAVKGHTVKFLED